LPRLVERAGRAEHTWLCGRVTDLEAWRRQLDDPVSAFPIAKAGPAHIATLKTFDPPLASLAGRRLAGAERRAKRLLFPTEDGELVLLVNLMSAGRLKYLRAGEKGPNTPAFQLEFAGGGRLVSVSRWRGIGSMSARPQVPHTKAGNPKLCWRVLASTYGPSP